VSPRNAALFTSSKTASSEFHVDVLSRRWDDRLVYLCLVNAVLAIPDAKRESDGTRGSESRPFDPDFFHFDSLRQPVLVPPNILQLYQAIAAMAFFLPG
jgi:hypothetical protein